MSDRAQWLLRARPGEVTIELRTLNEDPSEHACAVQARLTPAEAAHMIAALGRALHSALGGDPIGATRHGEGDDSTNRTH